MPSSGSTSSVLAENGVRIAVKPALPDFGRGDDGMSGRVRVLRRVLVGRVVTAPRSAAFLAGPQVNPTSSDFHAILADSLLGLFDGADCLNMGAYRRGRHRHFSYSCSSRMNTLRSE